MSTDTVVHNETARQFEISMDGATAILTYRLKPNSIYFEHTEVPAEIQGRGIAGQLARTGLAYAREKGLSVVPLCPFVASYIKKHPEYLEIVREDHRARLQAKEGEAAGAD